jgi:acyl-CoA synthetase (NDP forming)
VRNPLDLVASADASTYERALTVLLGGDEVDAILVIFTPPLVTRADDVAAAIVRAASGATKPIVACFLGHQGVPDALRTGERGVPSFAFPEAAVRALGRAADHAQWRQRPEGAVPEPAGIDRAGAARIVDASVAEGGGWLDPDVAVALCQCFEVPVLPHRRAATADEAADAAAELGFPVAMKAGNGAIVHKTDVGAVALSLAAAEDVRAAFRGMHDRLGDEMGGAIVQPMAEPGIETIVGVLHDPLFGPLVLFGMGGVTAELVRDTAMRLVPVSDVDAYDIVRSLKLSPLFFGYRGSPPVNTAALEALIIRVGLLANDLPAVAELDCNPVIVSPSGAVAVDVKIRVEQPQQVAPDVRALRAP